MMFIFASSVGLNFVLSIWDPATASWATGKPVIGGLIIFAALILNFIGYSMLIGRRRMPETLPEGSIAATSPRPASESLGQATS